MLGFHFGGAVAQRDLDAAPVGHANEADREMARARRFIDGPAIVSDLASVIFGKADAELQEIALFKKGDHFQRQTKPTCLFHRGPIGSESGREEVVRYVSSSGGAGT